MEGSGTDVSWAVSEEPILPTLIFPKAPPLELTFIINPSQLLRSPLIFEVIDSPSVKSVFDRILIPVNPEIGLLNTI